MSLSFALALEFRTFRHVKTDDICALSCQNGAGARIFVVRARKIDDSCAFLCKNGAGARVLSVRTRKIDDSCTLLRKSGAGARVLDGRTRKIDDSCTFLFKSEPGARVLEVRCAPLSSKIVVSGLRLSPLSCKTAAASRETRAQTPRTRVQMV